MVPLLLLISFVSFNLIFYLLNYFSIKYDVKLASLASILITLISSFRIVGNMILRQELEAWTNAYEKTFNLKADDELVHSIALTISSHMSDTFLFTRLNASFLSSVPSILLIALLAYFARRKKMKKIK